jgi:hypothetical protein
MNIKVDELAKLALHHAHLSDELFNGIYPHDNFFISMGGIKTTGPIRPALESHWGCTEARRFFSFQRHRPRSQL